MQWRIYVQVRVHSVVWGSVVLVANASFEQIKFLSKRTEQNHFMN